jgi:hypothetical protein
MGPALTVPLEAAAEPLAEIAAFATSDGRQDMVPVGVVAVDTVPATDVGEGPIVVAGSLIATDDWVEATICDVDSTELVVVAEGAAEDVVDSTLTVETGAEDEDSDEVATDEDAVATDGVAAVEVDSASV